MLGIITCILHNEINLIILFIFKQFNFGLAPQTFGLVTSRNSLLEGQRYLFIFVSTCRSRFIVILSQVFALCSADVCLEVVYATVMSNTVLTVCEALLVVPVIFCRTNFVLHKWCFQLTKIPPTVSFGEGGYSPPAMQPTYHSYFYSLQAGPLVQVGYCGQR